MYGRVTPPKQVTSPTWGSPPPSKQALSQATNPLGQPLQRDVRCVNDLFHSGAAAVYNGSLGTDDGDGNNNVKKSNRFRLAKQLCTCPHFFVHFFAVVSRIQRQSA